MPFVEKRSRNAAGRPDATSKRWVGVAGQASMRWVAVAESRNGDREGREMVEKCDDWVRIDNALGTRSVRNEPLKVAGAGFEPATSGL